MDGTAARKLILAAVPSQIKVRPIVNDLLGFALRQEIPLLRSHRRIPIGTSLLAVASAGAVRR